MTRDAFDLFQKPERGRFGENELRSDDRRVTKSNLVDLAMVLHAERPMAVLVSSDGNITNAKWMPRSQIEIELIGPLERKKNGRTVQACTIACPSWLAKEKGLV